MSSRVNPFFEVAELPVYRASRFVGHEPTQVPNTKILVNVDSGDNLGIVSDRYEVVTNEQVATLFDSAVEKLSTDIKVVDHLNGTGSKWYRDYIFNKEEFGFDVGGGDTSGLLIRTNNSYDGKTSYGFEIMLFRWICSNGMIMGKRELFKEGYRHFNNDVELLVKSINSKTENIHENVNIWRKWVDMPFTEEEFKAFLEDKDYVSDKLNAFLMEWWATLLVKERYKFASKWLAFNVLTYVATHEAKARKGSNAFSNKARVMNRLAGELYKTEEL